MQTTDRAQFTAAQAVEKISRRVRALYDIRVYGIRRGDTGTVIGVLTYKDGLGDIVVCWDPPRATVAAPPRKFQDIFDRLEYEALLEEIDARRE